MRFEEKGMIEQELKEVISEIVFLKILSLFQWNESFSQTNYYYTDYEGILREKMLNKL